jgi:hypothetical protein
MTRELQRADVSERIDAEWRGLYTRGQHAGALASASWLSSRCLCATAGGWEVTIALDATRGGEVDEDTRLHVAITAREWGVFFAHGGQTSWIRVTDVPFVHERDDFALLEQVPPLRQLGDLVGELEERYRLRFRREHAQIRSTLVGGEDRIRAWVITSL